jgi:hypothetical protein
MEHRDTEALGGWMRATTARRAGPRFGGHGAIPLRRVAAARRGDSPGPPPVITGVLPRLTRRLSGVPVAAR